MFEPGVTRRGHAVVSVELSALNAQSHATPDAFMLRSQSTVRPSFPPSNVCRDKTSPSFLYAYSVRARAAHSARGSSGVVAARARAARRFFSKAARRAALSTPACHVARSLCARALPHA